MRWVQVLFLHFSGVWQAIEEMEIISNILLEPAEKPVQSTLIIEGKRFDKALMSVL